MKCLSPLYCLSALLACSGDDSGSTTTPGSGSATTGASETGTTGGTTDTPTTDNPTTDNPTTDSPTTDSPTTDASTTGPSTTGDPTGSSSTGGTTGAPADESVTLREEPCMKTPGAATRCESYEVECEGLAPAIVDLAIYEGNQGVPSKGTILLGSGGEGTGFYNFTHAKTMLAAGYTLVDRRWPAGWFTGGLDGPQQAACHLAAVIRHLRASPPATGPLCATGNSGGSAELVYALTWQGAGPSLDFAMPTSGPFHRLDLACQGQADATWTAECAALLAANCPNCASKSCQLGPGPRTLMDVAFGDTPRCTAPGPGDLALLAARGPVLGPDVAGLALPVKFLIGELDDGAYAPLTTALHDALAAAGLDVSITFVKDAIHEMDTTPPGADAIRDALLAGCVPLP